MKRVCFKHFRGVPHPQMRNRSRREPFASEDANSAIVKANKIHPNEKMKMLVYALCKYKYASIIAEMGGGQTAVCFQYVVVFVLYFSAYAAVTLNPPVIY